MDTIKGSTTFTSKTAQRICILLDQMIGLGPDEQLKLDNEIRASGFNADDFSGYILNYNPEVGMTSYNFNWLVDDRRISIAD